MELKPGYKQSDVGAIPADWEILTIVEAMRLINGRAFKPRDWKQQGIPIIRIENLNDKACSFNYCDVYVEERHHVKPGDVLFAWSGTTGTSFGARVWDGPNAVLNQHIFKVIADKNRLTPYYSFLILRRVQEEIEKRAHGFKSSFVHVKKSDLLTVQLPVPPLPEQRAIAAALSDVHAMIASLDNRIAKKSDIKQAAMQQLLTGKQRLPGFRKKGGVKHTAMGVIPEDWEVKELGSILNRLRLGGNYPNQDQENDQPLMKMGNISRGGIDVAKIEYISSGINPDNSDRLKYGDLLFNTRNTLDLVGKVAIWRDELPVAYYNSNLMRLEFKTEEISSNLFANYAFNSASLLNRLRALATGTTSVAAIYTRDLKKLLFPVPTVPEQHAIAAVLSDMDAEIASLEARREKTKLLKQGMMQELLTGRIRLV